MQVNTTNLHTVDDLLDEVAEVDTPCLPEHLPDVAQGFQSSRTGGHVEILSHDIFHSPKSIERTGDSA
jgi:hypothetical protein